MAQDIIIYIPRSIEEDLSVMQKSLLIVYIKMAGSSGIIKLSPFVRRSIMNEVDCCMSFIYNTTSLFCKMGIMSRKSKNLYMFADIGIKISDFFTNETDGVVQMKPLIKQDGKV
jgi:hypothetical protein